MPDIQLSHQTSGIADVPGFKVSGVHCDIRNLNNGQLDLALIVSEQPSAAAGVFTTNDVVAAPVRICQRHLLENKRFRGVVVNSGNANACTGEQGMQDALSMATLAARACNATPPEMLVCSTGRIGVPLPMERISKGIGQAAEALTSDSEGGLHAAQAILTSDTREKLASTRITVQGTTVTLAGMAKGAGMIEPNMATMLAFLATDISSNNQFLQSALRKAVNQTFNRISIDGDMSTNDTVLLFANGASNITLDQTSDPQTIQLFQQALDAICEELATRIVADGEKVTKTVRLHVRGARSSADADKVARSVANSLLVKTSWYGNDPNWGRIMDAAGYARIGLEEHKVDLSYDTVSVLKAGSPQNENREAWKKVVSRPTFTITLNLNQGEAHCNILTADLSEAYVNFNKSE